MAVDMTIPSVKVWATHPLRYKASYLLQKNFIVKSCVQFFSTNQIFLSDQCFSPEWKVAHAQRLTRTVWDPD